MSRPLGGHTVHDSILCLFPTDVCVVLVFCSLKIKASESKVAWLWSWEIVHLSSAVLSLSSSACWSRFQNSPNHANPVADEVLLVAYCWLICLYMYVYDTTGTHVQNNSWQKYLILIIPLAQDLTVTLVWDEFVELIISLAQDFTVALVLNNFPCWGLYNKLSGGWVDLVDCFPCSGFYSKF